MTTRAFPDLAERFPRLSRLVEPLRGYELKPAPTRLGLIVQFAVASLLAAVLVAVFVLPGFLGVGTAAAAGASDFQRLPSNLEIQPFAQNTTVYAKQGGADVAIA